MKRIVPTLFIAAAMAAVAVPAFARDLVIPPAPLANAPPPIADEGQARAAMSLQGVRNINGVAQVGDYWEGQGSLNGRPVTAYLFANGAFETKPATTVHSELRQSAELPDGE